LGMVFNVGYKYSTELFAKMLFIENFWSEPLFFWK